MRNLFTAIGVLVLLAQNLTAQSLLEQKKQYTRADTLRGSLRPERTCYDVTFYELNIKIDTVERSITGSSRIVYNAIEDLMNCRLICMRT